MMDRITTRHIQTQQKTKSTKYKNKTTKYKQKWYS